MTEQAVVDLEVKQGATFRRSFVWKSRDSAGVTTAVPLTGYNARMQIASRAGGAALLTLTNDTAAADYNPHATLTLEAGGATGQVDIYIGATQTALLKRNGVYDLEFHLIGDPDEVTPLVGGAILLEKQVTE